MQVIPVFRIMTKQDTFDLTLISVIDALTGALIDRNQKNRYRHSRLTTAHELIHKIENSYEGYLPDEFINASKRFINLLHVDVNSLLKKIKEVQR